MSITRRALITVSVRFTDFDTDNPTFNPYTDPPRPLLRFEMEDTEPEKSPTPFVCDLVLTEGLLGWLMKNLEGVAPDMLKAFKCQQPIIRMPDGTWRNRSMVTQLGGG